MRKAWQKTEKKDSDLFGTKQQKASGSLDHYPTDSISDDLAIDSKYTTKNSYSISLKTWIKLVNEVAILGEKDNKNRIPLLSVHLPGLHLVTMGYEDFNSLWEDAWNYRSLKD